MDKIKDWLLTYRRFYIANVHWLYAVVIFIVYSILLYNYAYHEGWVDSYELFNKLRPHRPLIG